MEAGMASCRELSGRTFEWKVCLDVDSRPVAKNVLRFLEKALADGVVPDFKDKADISMDKPTWRFCGGKRWLFDGLETDVNCLKTCKLHWDEKRSVAYITKPPGRG